MTRIRLAPVTAVTCDDQFRIIENAAIHIENGALIYIGPLDDAPPFEAEETLGGEHIVAMPGLINTHTHAAMTLLRGYADDMALEAWLHTKIWPFEKNLGEDDVYWGTLLAIAEMLRGGTTCFADMYFNYQRGAQAMIESGIRACPGGVLLGFLPEPERRIADALNFARDYRGAGDGRITPFLAPHSLYTCNRAQWKSLIDGAREGGFLIQTHIAETLREVADVRAEWGATPLQTLSQIGALDGPLLATHCVHWEERDWEIARAHTRMKDEGGRMKFPVQSTAERHSIVNRPSNIVNRISTAGSDFNLRISHNPTSNLKLASGFAPIPQMLAAGLTVGIGTDGAASNNDLDMWEEMRLAALVHKATSGDATAISARQALWMATRDGARCLDLGSTIGTLEIGKRADVILLDFDQAHLTPCHNVASHLVYAAKASDVQSVIVDGKILLRDGELVALDVARIQSEARTRARNLALAAI